MKISIVTTCMNRSYSIKKTLLHNIINCLKFKNNVEFILLNYDSQDDLDEYINKNCTEYIQNGMLVYYKLQESVEYFHMSRAKNIVYKLSSGEIVHNADAEWLIYEPLIPLIQSEFITGNETKTLHLGGRGGGLVNYKKHFLQVGGYDERMIGWGFDDSDFYNRLRFLLGFEHKRTKLQPFVDNIHTRRSERNKNVPITFNTENYKIHKENMINKNWIVNKNVNWGSGLLLKNFKENIYVK